jgi:sortase A
MREPNAGTQTLASQIKARRDRVGARFAPFFSRLSSYTRRQDASRFFGSAKHRWPLALSTVGFLLLTYVGVQYLSMWHEQHVFAEEWTRQAAATRVAAPISVDGQSGIAHLVIPKINLDSVVIEGTSYRALKAGPGHLIETPLPGDSGNAVLAGHRDTFFRRLNDLSVGDSLVVERGGRTYQFAVAQREIVDPGDLSALRSSTQPMLTLITCYPPHFIGPAPKRLVIVGTLTDKTEAAAQEH